MKNNKQIHLTQKAEQVIRSLAGMAVSKMSTKKELVDRILEQNEKIDFLKGQVADLVAYCSKLKKQIFKLEKAANQPQK